jgi:glycosyltransferase involved in cell wall biosynthesis
MPKVSICIPTYNGARYIERTIRTVLSQTCGDFELIVNDDCSTDETCLIIGRFMRNDNRIKLHVNVRRLGLVNNWNQVLSHATGDYIKLLCQDDLLEDSCIEKQVHVLETFSEVSLVTCATKIIDCNGKVMMKRKYWRGSKMINGYKASKYSLWGVNLFGEPSISMYRRKELEKIGLYDARYGFVPDWDFSIRLMREGNLYHIDEYLTSFRVNIDTETGRLLNSKLLQLCMEEFEFFNRNGKVHGLHAFGKCVNHVVVLFKNLFYLIFQNIFFNHPCTTAQEAESFAD